MQLCVPLLLPTHKLTIPKPEVIAKRFDFFINEGDMPVFLALSLPDGQDFVIKIHILKAKVCELA